MNGIDDLKLSPFLSPPLPPPRMANVGNCGPNSPMERDPLCLYASCKFDLVRLNDQSYEINDQTRTQVNDDLKCVAMHFTDMWELLWRIHHS
jgi:hypothetical protein